MKNAVVVYNLSVCLNIINESALITCNICTIILIDGWPVLRCKKLRSVIFRNLKLEDRNRLSNV